MENKEKSTRLNRYTTLPVLLDMLRRRKIVLLDPNNWEDKNDSELIIKYKKRKRISKLFAICFCIGSETVHGWQAYARGISGCCIQFDRDKLVASLKTTKGIIHSHDVIYCLIKKVPKNEIDMMPFIKRWPYHIEQEFRIIWQGETEKDRIAIEFDLNSIVKITVSQEMPTSVKQIIEDLLRDYKLTIEVNSSTMFRNVQFIEAVEKATA